MNLAKQKICLFGGTFNPPHNGHLFMAEEVLRLSQYTAILFIPAFLPPHKKTADIAPEHRLAMLSLAIADNLAFYLDDCEIRRKGASYTVDTLKYIWKEYSLISKPGLLIGTDLLSSFDSWRAPEEILDLADLLVVKRKGDYSPESPFPHQLLENKQLPISSSEIRKRAYSGSNFRYLLPEKVYQYIKEKDLY